MNESNESEKLRSAVVKTLAIVGFLATLLLIVFLVASLVRHAPGAFSSLSGILNRLNSRDEVSELTIATDKTVVNSGESFQVTWTDIPLDGEYRFGYSCEEGITLEVRGEDGALVPLTCTDTLTLRDDVTKISISPISKEMRFSDVKLTVAFDDTEKNVSLENTLKVTIVNATIPFKENEEGTEDDEANVEEVPREEDVVTPIVPRAQSPYPASDPHGHIDLQMSIIGSGVLEGGVFSLSPRYDYNKQNALRFDVKNVGTKRSNVWSFSTVLPDGETYTSVPQIALGPNEHIEFTLGFFVNKEDGTSITLTPTLNTTGDTTVSNNSASVTVPVK